MNRHMTRKDYSEMPWANGRGTTIEILRKARVDGQLLWRFSIATVPEDGPFSHFPDIERNLTVIDGPGFDLIGEISLRADLLQPVHFAGDITLAAQNVTGVAVDFNVMTHRTLPLPRVEVVQNTMITALPDCTLCVFALGQAHFGDTALCHHDFLFGAKDATVTGAHVLVVHLFETAA